MTEEELYFLWLSCLDGLTSRKRKVLLEYFHSPREACHASEKLLRSIPGLSEHNVNTILSSKNFEKSKVMAERMEMEGISFISIQNEEYPSLLREISDPPLGLYVKGKLPSEEKIRVSIIGARKCSEYGMTVSRLLSKPLAQNGIVIVSGMARGVDSQAHKGAIDGGGDTIAVLGCGVDICYPAENRALREEIIQHGCALSEYPPGTQAIPAYFPTRNRIISGLSQVIVVVEAGEKSGTFITVDQALDQGREVMAVPGNITSKLSQGTNELIKQGATPVSRYEDILNHLGVNSDKDNFIKNNDNKDDLLAPEEKLVYDIINFEPVTFDEIVNRLNSQASTIHYVLTMLELKEMVKKLPGQRYIRSL